MKKVHVLILAVAMLLGMTSLCVSADEDTIGQFVFDKDMNVSWWDHHATCRTTYDAKEDAFKITPANGNACMCNGHNEGTIDYFEDMGMYPFPVGGEDGFNYVKIKIKLPKGFDISGSAYKAARLTLGDNSKGLGAWNLVDNPTFDFDGIKADGEWHEYIADLTVKHGVGASFEGQPSALADTTVNLSKMMFALGTNVDGPVYIKYIAFFETMKAAEAYHGEKKAPETKAPETKAPETKAPETQAPETKAPETAAPETKAPETAAPETKAPDTQAPETKAAETKANETAAGTGAADTNAPETKAPAKAKKGCGSIVASLAIVPMLLAAAYVCCKKH